MSELDPQVREAIRRHLEGGRKIEAIKLLREASGVGLAEAKERVEALERGDDPHRRGRSHAGSRRHAIGDPLPAKVQGLLRQGREIEAIKALREAGGLGLKEAKAAVDAYLDRHPDLRRLNPKGRGTTLAVVVAVVVALAAWYVSRMLLSGPPG